MAFADWKKRTKIFSLLPEGYRAMGERIAQAAYKAGERDGRKQVEQIAAQGAELAVMADRAGRRLVEIEWRNPDSDWPWFWLLRMDGEWLELKGADFPDGSAKHDGDSFWVHKSDVRTMRSNDQHNQAERSVDPG